MFARIHAEVVDFVLALPRDVVLVSGGAKGVDSIAADCFARRGLGDRVCVYLPRPEEHSGSYGRAAFARNMQIEEDADECHAWPSPWGKGTQNTIKLFRGAGKPCVVHEVERAAARERGRG